MTETPWWDAHRHADRRPLLLARNRIQRAIRRWLEKDLQRFVGQPNSPLVRAEVSKIMMGKLGIGIHADNAGGRFHHVSLEYTLGIGTDGDVKAVKQ